MTNSEAMDSEHPCDFKDGGVTEMRAASELIPMS